MMWAPDESSYAMFLYDDATSQVLGASPAQLVGTGVVDGTELLMQGTLVCRPGGNPIRERIFFSFEYDAGTETLTDFTGVVRERAA